MISLDEARKTINRLLSEVRCGDFPRPEKVFSISSEATVEEAVMELGKRHFLSAPVFNPAVAPSAPWNEVSVREWSARSPVQHIHATRAHTHAHMHACTHARTHGDGESSRESESLCAAPPFLHH